jgi:hypothetical protein
MREAVESQEIPIEYTPKFREFGVRVLDGGTSTLLLIHCPGVDKNVPIACATSGSRN